MKYSQYVSELIDWLKIPSISGEIKYRQDLDRAALWLVGRLHKLGFEAQTMETDFLPVVFGELKATSDKEQVTKKSKKAPTVLIYGHYDVQAPEPLDEWHSKPFEPKIKNGNLYARGVADDKGQFYTWVAAIDEILEGIKKDKEDFPVNIKILCEGAEEEGSRGLSEFIRQHKQLLAADVCVVSDTHCLSPSQPVITYGLKGLYYTQLEIQTLAQDAHSGIYGGNVLNAATVLSQVIAQLKAKDHRVLIPGFYDPVRKLSAKETKDLATYPWKAANIKAEVGATVVAGEKNYSVAARAGARPTIDINGIWSGYQGEGSKTIIPAQAAAKISMRLVPFQNPAQVHTQLSDYLDTIVPKGATYTLNQLTSSEPVLIDRSSNYFKLAEQAYKSVFGQKPVYELSGGSIGVVADFKHILGIDTLLMGYGLPDDGLHSPNEKMSLEMFEKGIQTNSRFLKLLIETQHNN